MIGWDRLALFGIFAIRGLNVVGLPLLDNDVILFERFGSSGGGIIELLDMVSFALAFACKFAWDADNDTEELCIWTLANTEKSCADDIVPIVPVGDCSPSLLL